MIISYHRPKTLDEALALIARDDTVPLGGGTLLSQGGPGPVQAVDLQLLGLDFITKVGNNLELGATLTLQTLLESDHCPKAMKSALKLEAPLNIRNTATVAGTLVSCDGRSSFASMLLAMDARITVKNQQEEKIIAVGEFLPLRDLQGALITSVSMPLNVKVAFEYAAKTPADKPIVSAAIAQWNSGRTRLALGGYGKGPLLAMDGTESEGIVIAARNAFHESADEWGSAEYRMDAGATLAKRCLASL